MTDVKRIACNHGFARCFILKIARFSHYENRLADGTLHALGRGLSLDPKANYPWANAVLMLLYPYEPLPAGAALSGYYLASNAAYHAGQDVIADFTAAGVRAERCYLPVRECAMMFGLGTPLKNGLTCWDEFGTRAAVQTLTAALPEPVEYESERAPRATSMYCENCHACERACPTGAIDAGGFDCFTCLRGRIDGETVEPEIMEKMPLILGCELCQYACPVNAKIPSLDVPLPEFDLRELLTGNVKPALALVGRNENKGGRLIAHAAVIAANRRQYDLLPLIEALREDARPLVKSCADWAAAKLKNV